MNASGMRTQVITAMRQYRAAWIPLAKMLNDIAYCGDYRDWGYDEFEDYCRIELFLEKSEVRRLMVACAMLKNNDPERIDAVVDFPEGEAPPAPDDKPEPASDGESTCDRAMRHYHDLNSMYDNNMDRIDKALVSNGIPELMDIRLDEMTDDELSQFSQSAERIMDRIMDEKK